MANKIAVASGNLSDASVWRDCNLQTGTLGTIAEAVYLINSHSYSSYFTPSSATNSCAGFMAMFTSTDSTSRRTLTARLYEGAAIRAEAKAYAHNDNADNQTCAYGQFFFRFNNYAVPITAYADSATSPGVKTTVTSNGHGLTDGTSVRIANSTDATYNGLWVISNKTTNTFDITVAYATNPADGDWSFEYGNTTASSWRFSINAGVNPSQVLIRANSGSSTVIWAWEILNASTTAPTTGDGMYIMGNGTTLGTTNSVSVTVDSSFSGTSLSISKGGQLTWGTSQAASYTLTLSGTLSVYSSASGVFGLEMGTEENPLTKDYVQTIAMTTSAYSTTIGNTGNPLYGGAPCNNSTPANISMWGNYQYNQATADSWRTTLSAQANATATSLVFTDDLGLRAGGGDILIIEGTNGTRQTETRTTSAYDSATKTATVSALTNTHVAGAYVWLMSANAKVTVDGTRSAYIAVMPSHAAIPDSAYHSTLKLGYVQTSNLNEFLNTAPTASSVIKYLRCTTGNAGYLTIQMGMPKKRYSEPYFDKCVFSAGAALSYDYFFLGYQALAASSNYGPSGGKTEFRNCVFVNPIYAGATLISQYSRNILTDCMVVDFGVNFSGCGNEITNLKVNGTNNAYDLVLGSKVDNFESFYTGLTASIYTEAGSLITFVANDVITNVFFYDSTIPNNEITTSDISSDAAPGTKVRFQKINGNSDDCRLYAPEGHIVTTGVGLDDTTTKTTGELSLGVFPHSTATDEFSYSIKKVVAANNTVAWYGYYRKNASYGSSTLPTVTLTSDDGAINTTATITDVDDTWVFFSLSGQVGAGTSTVSLTITAQSANASAAAYFADMQLVIGDATSGSASGFKVGTLWKEGEPTADEVLGGTVDGTFLRNAVGALTVGQFMGLK
jgi:hypothetical protein